MLDWIVWGEQVKVVIEGEPRKVNGSYKKKLLRSEGWEEK